MYSTQRIWSFTTTVFSWVGLNKITFTRIIFLLQLITIFNYNTKSSTTGHFWCKVQIWYLTYNHPVTITLFILFNEKETFIANLNLLI